MAEQATMQRAHSLLVVKRADAEARTIRGVASTPTLDRQNDVLVPQGAVFKLPLPLLDAHNHGAPLGQVTDARATPQGIFISAKIAPEGTSARIDESWALIRAGLIRGLSVGFIGVESSVLPNGGRKFTKWEVIEVSAVVVPANREAEITEVKKLDQAQAATQAGAEAIPCYPGHLTEAERAAVWQKAARDLVDRTVVEVARKLGTAEAKVRERFATAEHIAAAEHMIITRWHGERLASLEAKLAALEGGKPR